MYMSTYVYMYVVCMYVFNSTGSGILIKTFLFSNLSQGFEIDFYFDRRNIKNKTVFQSSLI